MKYKIILIALAVIVVFPTVTLGESFIGSLIQGKTPSEAIQIIAEQVDTLLGRVQTLETQQAENAGDVELLKQENARLRGDLDTKADIVIPPTETKECLDLKAQIYAVQAENDVPSALTEKLTALKRELSDPQLGGHSETSDQNDLNKTIAEYQAKQAELEQQIKDAQTQIKTYSDQKKGKLALLVEKEQANGCIVGQ